MRPPRRDPKRDGPATRVRDDYGLGAIATARAPKRLTFIAASARPLLFGHPRRFRMRPDARAAEERHAEFDTARLGHRQQAVPHASLAQRTKI